MAPDTHQPLAVLDSSRQLLPFLWESCVLGFEGPQQFPALWLSECPSPEVF